MLDGNDKAALLGFTLVFSFVLLMFAGFGIHDLIMHANGWTECEVTK